MKTYSIIDYDSFTSHNHSTTGIKTLCQIKQYLECTCHFYYIIITEEIRERNRISIHLRSFIIVRMYKRIKDIFAVHIMICVNECMTIARLILYGRVHQSAL